jgi:hypothetical protein
MLYKRFKTSPRSPSFQSVQPKGPINASSHAIFADLMHTDKLAKLTNFCLEYHCITSQQVDINQ